MKFLLCSLSVGTLYHCNLLITLLDPRVIRQNVLHLIRVRDDLSLLSVSIGTHQIQDLRGHWNYDSGLLLSVLIAGTDCHPRWRLSQYELLHLLPLGLVCHSRELLCYNIAFLIYRAHHHLLPILGGLAAVYFDEALTVITSDNLLAGDSSFLVDCIDAAAGCLCHPCNHFGLLLVC